MADADQVIRKLNTSTDRQMMPGVMGMIDTEGFALY